MFIGVVAMTTSGRRTHRLQEAGGDHAGWIAPDPGNDMLGRTGFFIHGDSAIFPGWASAGCIVILDLAARQRIGQAVSDGMTLLEVRPEFG